ncbi:hypothetical protein JTE90_010163, partial [Oedothorax gibbosus]
MDLTAADNKSAYASYPVFRIEDENTNTHYIWVTTTTMEQQVTVWGISSMNVHHEGQEEQQIGYQELRRFGKRRVL